LAGILAVYSITLFLAGLHLSVKHKTVVYVLGAPLAIACMHLSWGAGFLWGMISPQQRKTG